MKLMHNLNQKGFAIMTLTVGLSMMTACLMVLTSLIFSVRNYDLAQKICIEHAFSAQKSHKKSINKLLLLNPLATFLRLKQKTLEMALKVAIVPKVIAALKIAIKVVKKERKLLDKKQKSILKKSKQNMNKIFRSFNNTISSKIKDTQYIRTNHHNPYPLAVKPKQKDIAPNYDRVPNFSKKQTVTFKWNMVLQSALPKWLEKEFFEQGYSSYKCSATLKKKGLSWKVTLTDKQSGKSNAQNYMQNALDFFRGLIN